MSQAAHTYIGVPIERPKRTSELLRELAATHQAARISIRDLVNGLGDRAFGVLMFAFAAPNLPPLGIPGISSICAVPIIYLSIQLMLGRSQPNLPTWLLDRSFPTSAFRSTVKFIVPWLERIERVLKPRLAACTSRSAERLLGLIVLGLAVILVLPIPFGNLLPAFAIAIIALAIAERDGVAAIIGYCIALLSVVFVAGLVVGAIELAFAGWRLLFE